VKPYYEQDGITIYHGDCRGRPIDTRAVVITDPPYGVTDHGWDVVVPAHEWMHGAACVATATEPYATHLINTAPLRFRYDLVWEKNTASNAFNAKDMPMRMHERVLIFGVPHYTPLKRQRTPVEMSRLNAGQRKRYPDAHPSSVLRFEAINNRNTLRVHPSQKPVELMDWLVRSFTADNLIVDPFMGSGTTLVAAYRAGRRAIGIEIEERYCEIAAKRLAQAVLPLGVGA
jgi:site-specific DNA-methyltransferase (adenine-specific)